MSNKGILIFLIIIVLIFSYHYVLGNQKVCIRLSIKKPYSNIESKFKSLFCNVLTMDGQIEYEDEDFVIVGGKTILLPDKNGGINIQGYLKENEEDCLLILAYPALPLESY